MVIADKNRDNIPNIHFPTMSVFSGNHKIIEQTGCLNKRNSVLTILCSVEVQGEGANKIGFTLSSIFFAFLS